MFLLRWLSLILVVLAVMLIGADVVTTLERGGVIVMRSFDQILMLFGAGSATWVQRGVPQSIVDAARVVFSWPAWLLFGLPGGVLALLVPEKDKEDPLPPPPIHR